MLRLIKPGDIVLDYSSWRPTKAELQELGVKAVVRYIAPGKQRAKLISQEEISFLHSEPYPVGVLLVFEWQADRANYGGTVGLSDGYWSREKCRELGYPATQDLALIIAIDTNTTNVNVEAHRAYSVAFDRGLGEYTAMGIYGDSDIIAYCIENKITILNWLVGARSWGHDLTGVHVEQLVQGSTASYDMNKVHIPFYVWLPSANDEQGEEEMQVAFFEVEGLPGQYIWAPGIDPIPFTNPVDRDVLLKGLGIPEGTGGKISQEMYVRLFTSVNPVGPVGSTKFVFRGEGETS